MAQQATKAIDSAIRDLKTQAAEIAKQIEALEKAQAVLGGKRTYTRKASTNKKKSTKKKGARKGKGMSAAARAETSRRMKAYWAARRKNKGKKVAKKATKKTATKKAAAKQVTKKKAKRNLTPAARKALSDRMKKKWEAYRAKKG